MFHNIDGLNCLYTNADSMINKIDEFRTIVKNSKPHIIGITELKPKNSCFDIEIPEINLPGYELFTSSLQNGPERGCAIYIDRSLNPSVSHHQYQYKDAIWCELGLVPSL